jgi:hypothetical protein
MMLSSLLVRRAICFSAQSRRQHRDIRVMRVRGALICCIVIAVAAAAPREAWASCVAPEPRIVWSYPADGETEVPLNARIFIVTNVLSPQIVTINGDPLVLEPDKVGYGAKLAPNTDYIVTLEPSSPFPPKLLTFKFTTGATAVAPEIPSVPGVSRITAKHERAFTPQCQAAWEAMDCFDTGQDTHLVFETPARPLLFMVQSLGPPRSIPWPIAWPGVCGDPEVFVGSFAGICGGSYYITAISRTGDMRSVDIPCDRVRAAALPPLQGSISSQGCAVGGPAHAPLPMLIFFLLLLRRSGLLRLTRFW